MKPLQTLDYVMLWIARIFAVFSATVLAFLIALFIVMTRTKPDVAVALVIFVPLEILYVSWTIALWRLNHSAAQSYLQITLLIYLAAELLGYAGFFGNVFRPDLNMFRFNLIGSVAIFWSAARPHFSNPVLPPIPHASC